MVPLVCSANLNVLSAGCSRLLAAANPCNPLAGYGHPDQKATRWRFVRRLGLALFGGTGSISAEFGELRSDEFLPAGGADVNVRIPYAVGEDSDGLYFSIGEAF